MTNSHVEPSKNYKRIMKNHTLKIENLPIMTEELSNDELAAVKGGLSIALGLSIEVFRRPSIISILDIAPFFNPPPIPPIPPCLTCPLF